MDGAALLQWDLAGCGVSQPLHWEVDGLGQRRRAKLGVSTHVETIEDRAGVTQIQRVNSVVLRSGQGPMAGSGGDWQSTQPGQGAAELVFPRPGPGEHAG